MTQNVGAAAQGRRRPSPKLTAWGLLLAATAVLAEPHLSGMGVRLEDQRVLLSFRLQDALDEKVLDRIDSGLPTGFLYQFELTGLRRLWFDKTLATRELEVVAMYDALERQYLVHYKLGGKLMESRLVKDLASLRSALTELYRVEIFSLEDVAPHWRLQVRVRAQVRPRTVLGMIPSTVTTEWVESPRFRAVPPAP
jgi:hypothetical protein